MKDSQHGSIVEVLGKCQQDRAFRAKLLAEPMATLTAQGVELPAGVEIRVVEDSPTVMYLVLPPYPAALSDEELDGVVGGNAPSPYPTVQILQAAMAQRESIRQSFEAQRAALTEAIAGQRQAINQAVNNTRTGAGSKS